MSKRNKILYWVSTIWLAFGMLSSGLIQLFKMKEEVDFILNLGYPEYFLTILGVWKILGTVVILFPKFPLLKEWAYAGMFFTMSGAVFSHAANGAPAKEYFGPIFTLVLIVVSWYFRPASKKVAAANI